MGRPPRQPPPGTSGLRQRTLDNELGVNRSVGKRPGDCVYVKSGGGGGGANIARNREKFGDNSPDSDSSECCSVVEVRRGPLLPCAAIATPASTATAAATAFALDDKTPAASSTPSSYSIGHKCTSVESALGAGPLPSGACVTQDTRSRNPAQIDVDGGGERESPGGPPLNTTTNCADTAAATDDGIMVIETLDRGHDGQHESEHVSKRKGKGNKRKHPRDWLVTSDLGDDSDFGTGAGGASDASGGGAGGGTGGVAGARDRKTRALSFSCNDGMDDCAGAGADSGDQSRQDDGDTRRNIVAIDVAAATGGDDRDDRYTAMTMPLGYRDKERNGNDNDSRDPTAKISSGNSQGAAHGTVPAPAQAQATARRRSHCARSTINTDTSQGGFGGAGARSGLGAKGVERMVEAEPEPNRTLESESKSKSGRASYIPSNMVDLSADSPSPPPRPPRSVPPYRHPRPAISSLLSSSTAFLEGSSLWPSSSPSSFLLSGVTGAARHGSAIVGSVDGRQATALGDVGASAKKAVASAAVGAPVKGGGGDAGYSSEDDEFFHCR